MKIELFGTEITIPQSLNELSKKQLAYLVRMIIEDIDPDCIKILLFNRILKDSAPLKLKLKMWYELELKVRWSKTRLAKIVHSFCNIEVQKFITQDNIDVIMSVMDFLFSKDDRLITQKFPIVRNGTKFYKSPQDYCTEIGFSEFYNIEISYLRYRSNPSSKTRSEFCRTLYSRLVSSPNLWYYFSAKSIDSPVLQELGVYYWEGVRTLIFEEFPYFFKSKKSGAEIDLEEYEQKWEDMLGVIAEHPHLYEKTANTDVRFVLHHANLKIKEQQELQE